RNPARWLTPHVRPVLQSAADAAVLAHAPEVDGDEDADSQRDGDTVQNVEAQQRVAADETPAEQDEARIPAGVNERDAAHLEKACAGSLVAQKRRRPRHVAADGNGPNGKLVPWQQVAGEA